MDIARILELAEKAIALYQQADDLVRTVKTSVASSKEALSTKDQERLNQLLAQAQERRRAAAEALDALL